MKTMHYTNRKSAFTLVEISVVVGIIAMVSAMGVPGFLRARERSQAVRFANDLRTASDAFAQYSLENNSYPAELGAGQVPAGMGGLLTKMQWAGETSVGGSWDWDLDQNGVRAGITVANPTGSEAQMQEVDRIVDDGNLGTGVFRSCPSGYTYVLEE